MELTNLIKDFIIQSYGLSLEKRKYITNYNDLQIRVSFGQGSKAKVTWMGFFKESNRAQKGIYPVILFDYSNNCLVVAYGVSETEKPTITWPQEIIKMGSIKEFKCTKCKIENIKKKYPSSIVKDCFEINSKNLNLETINNIAKSIEQVIEEYNSITFSQTHNNQTSKNQQPLNLILYGPPGTGKTYAVVEKALKIIAQKENIEIDWDARKKVKEKFKEYQKKGQIAFITFHQSYSYEEFVEGIKAETSDDEDCGTIRYYIEKGIFREICEKAQEKGESQIDEFIEKLKHDAEENPVEINKRNGFFVTYRGGKTFRITPKKSKYADQNRDYPVNIQAIKEVYKDPKKIDLYYNPTYIKGILEYFYDLGLKKYEDIQEDNNSKNFILIIDEINRANISKVFGELITLIEEKKRLGADEELTVTLPYSKEEFGVPQNLYIIGTMNTADRSIALLDTALRRRFHFEEMMPDPTKLPKNLDDINLQEMLTAINARIEYLLDRDHTIGHAYFLNVENLDDLKLDDLKEIFYYKIIPLLAEYFYDDWESIQKVLNDNGMIIKKRINDKYLKNIEQSGKKIFEVSNPEHWDEKTFKAIYEEKNENSN